MSAEIIILPTARFGRRQAAPPMILTAREALTEIAFDQPFPVDPQIAEAWADDVTAKLWERGFIVVTAGDKVIA